MTPIPITIRGLTAHTRFLSLPRGLISKASESRQTEDIHEDKAIILISRLDVADDYVLDFLERRQHEPAGGHRG